MTENMRTVRSIAAHRVRLRRRRAEGGTLQVQQCSDAIDLTATEIVRQLDAGTLILMQTATVVGCLASPMHRRTIDHMDLLLDHASFGYSVKIPDLGRAEDWVDFTAVDYSLLDLMPAEPITLVSPCRTDAARRLAAALHAPNPERIGVQVYGTHEEHRISAAAGIPLISAAVPAGERAAVTVDDAIDALKARTSATGLQARVLHVRTSAKGSDRPSAVLESIRRRRDLAASFIVHRRGDLDLVRAARAANTIYTKRVIDEWT